ncbi:MAG: hypothetical protein U0361_02055 [Nitrospiraceae bacterium]
MKLQPGHAGRLSRKLAAELKNLNYPFVYREHDHIHPMAGGHFFPREELLIE